MAISPVAKRSFMERRLSGTETEPLKSRLGGLGGVLGLLNAAATGADGFSVGGWAISSVLLETETADLTSERSWERVIGFCR